MSQPVRLAINGASGRMGHALQGLLATDARFQLVAGVDTSHDWSSAPSVAVVIDFSAPVAFDAALAYCLAQRAALVTGTTGLVASQQAALKAAGEHIPVLHAANFSLGIAVLTRAVQMAAAALPDWDLEIVEAHHARKVDAPSGTALALGRAAALARGQDLDTVAVRSRDGQVGARIKGAIGFSAIRGGDIVGEHTILLAGTGERVELTHRATDRSIFARGALAAAAWLASRPAGIYALADVLAAPSQAS